MIVSPMMTALRRRYWMLREGIERACERPVRLPTVSELADALEPAPLAMPAAGEGSASRANTLAERAWRHFTARATPRFFADVPEIRAIAHAASLTHPDWARQSLHTALESIRDFRDPSTSVFCARWNALPLGPGRDTLAWHRPHQLAWVTQLARAIVHGHPLTGTLIAGLDSWLRSIERSRRSPAYGDALIAVHRGVAVTWALHFLWACGSPSEGASFDLLRVLLSDVRFVHSRLGESYPNNHLLADGFFCWYVGLLFPEFKEADRWRRDGEALWLAELERQVLADGTSFEHSVHYHELVCEMVTAYVLLHRRNGLELLPWVHDSARAMLSFQAALGGPDATAVPIGDGVEDSLFPLDGCAAIGSGAHREILRALYDAPIAPLDDDANGLERATWLLSGAVAEREPQHTAAIAGAFSRGGIFVLARGTAGRDRLVFRTGPQRGEPLAPGHMHADLLSIAVTLDGEPILVDPGTYTYRGRSAAWPADSPNWRQHFMSAAAHSGPFLPGVDPLGRGTGDFPAAEPRSWVRHDAVLGALDVERVRATIEGASSYSGQARLVVQLSNGWLVVDRFTSHIEHPVLLNFQFAHDVKLARAEEGVMVARGSRRRLALVTWNLGPPECLHGSSEPLAGWVSPAYGTLCAAPCARFAPVTRSWPAVTALIPEPDVIPVVRSVRNAGATLEIVLDTGTHREKVYVDWDDDPWMTAP